MPSKNSSDFFNGLVFGFDVGTGSIGYAVRRGAKFLDVGVLICPENTNDLEDQRNNRRQRRTLDHRLGRRDWFAESLAVILDLKLHQGTRLPQSGWRKNEKGGWVPVMPELALPVSLRVDALAGKPLEAEQLFTALVHLIKRRGPANKVPWSKTLAEEQREKDEQIKESASDTIPADQVSTEFETARQKFLSANPSATTYHPAHYLNQLDEQEKRQRKRAWARDLVEAEAKAILEAQNSRFDNKFSEEKEFTDVSGKTRKITVADWLLHGNSFVQIKSEGENKKQFHVFARNYQGRERAPFTFQAARIHNRKPGLDLVEPYDEQGRPRYVLSREHPEYKKWQVEVALLGFRVRDLTSAKTNATTVPSAEALLELREIISRKGELAVDDLQAWVKPYKEKKIFDLVKEQPGLVGEGKGRGRFNIFGLREAIKIIRPLQEEHKAMSKLTPKGQRARKKLKTAEDKADAYVRQYVNYTPKLRFNWKNPDTQVSEPEPLPRALRRYIQEIRDPVVRHRVELFDRMLDGLLEKTKFEGAPVHVIVECVRELEQDVEDAQKAWDKRKNDREQNQIARATLRDMGIVEPTDKDIRKFRLLQECKWKCPYTLERLMQAEFDDLVINRIVPPTDDSRRPSYLKAAYAAMKITEVEHMIPQSTTVCDEWFNLTVTRADTNKAKGDRIPYEFALRDADKDKRNQIIENAEEIFRNSPLKLEVFCSPEARSIIPKRDKLQRTAYIARCLRYVCLLKFGWLSPEDRDPAHDKANDVSRHYLVTNGGLTHRLRKEWGLDELLRETIPSEKWAAMTDLERERALTQGAKIPSDEWKKLDKAKQDEALRARRTKNRQDVRHHALDAMVVSCTAPWAANLTIWAGGWCNLDPEDHSISSIRCPLFGKDDYGQGFQAAAAKILGELKSSLPGADKNTIKHYRSNERHKQVFESQLYGLREKYDGKILDAPVFIVSQKLSELTSESLNPASKGKLIFSEKIREHIASEWKAYTANPKNWQRVLERTQFELEKSKAEALAKSAKPTTVEALNKRLWRVGQWLKEIPNAELWTELQKFLHKEGGALQPKAVFPTDFIVGLRHWLYKTEIRSVQVIAQTKDRDAYVELRAGSKTFWKYKGRYEEMRVFALQPKKTTGKGKYICWLVRPFYKRMKMDSGRLQSSKEAKTAAIPQVCRGLNPVTVFRNGQVVKFKNPAKGMDISHNWIISETTAGNSATNASVVLMPAHLAKSVRDPDNPKKLINLKETEGVQLALNEFMFALGYEPPKKVD